MAYKMLAASYSLLLYPLFLMYFSLISSYIYAIKVWFYVRVFFFKHKKANIGKV